MCKKCKTKYCRREAKRSNFCFRCEHENRKKNNPYIYWLGVNRRNAKRRGKYWDISLEYWVEWCDDNGYLALKGRDKHSMSIDCVINELGYIDGNLAPLTVSDNSKKGTKQVEWDYIHNKWEIVYQPIINQSDDLPF